MAAALEKGAIAPHERIDCGDGTLRVPGKTIRDKEPRGVLDPAGILRVSSNIGAVHVAYALGPQDHFEMLRRFGFGETTGAGFPDESAGVLRSWREWRPVDHATIAFGQGVSVTPIQLAAATAALANGGKWLAPRLVEARRAPGGAWQPVPRSSPRRVISPETARQVLRMLETVVARTARARSRRCPACASQARPAPRRSSTCARVTTRSSASAPGSSAWRLPTRRAS